MRMQLARGRQCAGNVLVVTLFISLVAGSFLIYYLNLVSTQNKFVARSQAWNASLAVAEAGVEEALAQLNPGAPVPNIDRAANGWGGPSSGIYGPVVKSLSAGSYSVYLTTDPMPVIYSTGYVTNSALSAVVKRTLRVTTTNTALFSVAMVAKYDINLNGNGVGTDSFNSADPNFSTGGVYDPAKASTNGDVGSLYGIVNVGNADVHGSVYLGPNGTDSVSKNGVVTGGVSNDFNVEFEDVVLPQTNWSAAASLATATNVDGLAYQFFFDGPSASGYYSVDGSLLNNVNLYVGTNTQVKLLISGSASPAVIRVAGAGTNAGQLTIYMDGPTFALSGTNTVDSLNALSLSYYGTTNNTALNINGSAGFIGTIYAPQADFKLNGGGSGVMGFVGASMTRTVTMTGNFNFHFDENLLANGPKRGYVATSWHEL